MPEVKIPESKGASTRTRERRIRENPAWRHLFMAGLSAVIIGIVLWVSYTDGPQLFADDAAVDGAKTPSGRDCVMPYLTNTAGVLLFIMHTSRRKRDRWKIRDYWGDHCYRLAESFAYLFIVLWAWPEGTDPVVKQVPPKIIGFLVGLYIVRVERAMDGLGDKFEEILTTILPRATQYVSAEERRRQQLRAVYRVDDTITQYASLRPLIDDLGARAHIDKLVESAQTAVTGDDPDLVPKAVDELTRTFDDVRRGIGETIVPVEVAIRAGLDKSKGV